MTGRSVRPHRASGVIAAPSSKSYTHRALVAGFFAQSPYRVEEPLLSDDTRATRDGLKRLGARFRCGPRRWTILERGPARAACIECHESGTTLRFLAAVAATGTEPVRFVGDGRLQGRPMNALEGALEQLGVRVSRPPHASLPLTIQGPMRAGRVDLDASVSSQFVSALLLTLPTLSGRSEIRLVGSVVSQPYIDATLAVLRYHGVRVERHGRNFRVPGDQRYRRRSFHVPGDASSAAYLLAAAAVTNGDVTVTNLPRAWPQADRGLLPILRSAGARVVESADRVRVRGGALSAFSVDVTDSPDLYPLIGVLGALAHGRTVIRGAPHVVHKESNRRTGTVRLLRALGARATVRSGALWIDGRPIPVQTEMPRSDDHRMVMSAVVGVSADLRPRVVGDASRVAKSYPGFWKDMARIGITSRVAE